MKGKKGFGSGDDWNGNKSGRPKSPDFRAKFTQELIESSFDDTKNIVGQVARFAMDGEQWALKLYCSTVLPYMLIKPKTEMEVTGTNNNELVEMLKTIPTEKLIAFQNKVAELAREIEGDT
jgi:hypothetical protein